MISAFGIIHKVGPGTVASNARHGYRIARVVGPHGKTEKHVMEHLKPFKGARTGYKVGKHPVAATSVLGGTTAASAGGTYAAKRRKK